MEISPSFFLAKFCSLLCDTVNREHGDVKSWPQQLHLLGSGCGLRYLLFPRRFTKPNLVAIRKSIVCTKLKMSLTAIRGAENQASFIFHCLSTGTRWIVCRPNFLSTQSRGVIKKIEGLNFEILYITDWSTPPSDLPLGLPSSRQIILHGLVNNLYSAYHADIHVGLLNPFSWDEFSRVKIIKNALADQAEELTALFQTPRWTKEGKKGEKREGYEWKGKRGVEI